MPQHMGKSEEHLQKSVLSFHCQFWGSNSDFLMAFDFHSRSNQVEMEGKGIIYLLPWHLQMSSEIVTEIKEPPFRLFAVC